MNEEKYRKFLPKRDEMRRVKEKRRKKMKKKRKGRKKRSLLTECIS